MLWLTFWIVAAVIALLGIVVMVNSLRLRASVARDVQAMWSASAEARPIDRSRIETLPSPARRYLNLALGDRTLAVRTVRFRHGGRFRTRLDGPWQKIRGEQYESDNPPAFVWWGRLPVVPGFWIDARDRCLNGEGNMLIRAASTVTLANRSGPQLDQGAMLRLLSDLVLFPASMLDARYVTWSAIDANHARATLTLNGKSVSGVFQFDADGLPRAFHAERYMDTGAGSAQLLPWSGEYEDYRPVDGMLVPHHFIGYWQVNGQRIPYVDFLIDTPEYDRTAPFGAGEK